MKYFSSHKFAFSNLLFLPFYEHFRQLREKYAFKLKIKYIMLISSLRRIWWCTYIWLFLKKPLHSTKLFKIFFSLLTLSTAFLQKASGPGKRGYSFIFQYKNHALNNKIEEFCVYNYLRQSRITSFQFCHQFFLDICWLAALSSARTSFTYVRGPVRVTSHFCTYYSFVQGVSFKYSSCIAILLSTERHKHRERPYNNYCQHWDEDRILHKIGK